MTDILKLLAQPVTGPELDLSIRAGSVLDRAGFHTIADVCALPTTPTPSGPVALDIVRAKWGSWKIAIEVRGCLHDLNLSHNMAGNPLVEKVRNA